MYVVPKEGSIIRDPLSGIIMPAEGRNVADVSYWRRRVKAGDVRVVENVHEPVAEEKPKKAKSKPGKKSEDD